jgi:hypothetical protein
MASHATPDPVETRTEVPAPVFPNTSISAASSSTLPWNVETPVTLTSANVTLVFNLIVAADPTSPGAVVTTRLLFASVKSIELILPATPAMVPFSFTVKPSVATTDPPAALQTRLPLVSLARTRFSDGGTPRFGSASAGLRN